MSFVGELRKFQKPAHEAMLDRRRVLVAYEMGLGKTPITIAVVEDLLEEGEVDCGLIVAQSSTKYQWEREIHKFSDRARVLVVDGDPRERERQYRAAQKSLYEYVILSYENVVRDFEQVIEIPIEFMVCDEATWIKGFTSQRSKKVKQIRPKYRFALTGQPVENRPEELFSIMQWVNPKVLGNFIEFERTFIARNKASGVVKRYRNLRLLHKTMGTAMVRATWDEPEIQAQMPKVVEENEYIDLDPAGRKLYHRIAAELLALLHEVPTGSSFNLFAHYGMADDPEAMKARGEMMSRITAVNMLCDAPELLVTSADLYEKSQGNRKPKGSAYCYELKQKGLLKGLRATPKLDMLIERITEQLDANPKNKIVVFSQHPAMLRMVESRLGTLTKCATLIGSMTAKQRDASRQRFLDDPYTRVFLSSDAGGYGVDLPNANYLHNYDLPWSAGKLKQRNGRIVRLSSEFRNVTMTNWLARNTVEERRYEMLVQKKGVASAWIDGKDIKGKHGSYEITIGTLTEFLEEHIEEAA